jgi:hypothetical protein
VIFLEKSLDKSVFQCNYDQFFFLNQETWGFLKFSSASSMNFANFLEKNSTHSITLNGGGAFFYFFQYIMFLIVKVLRKFADMVSIHWIGGSQLSPIAWLFLSTSINR